MFKKGDKVRLLPTEKKFCKFKVKYNGEVGQEGAVENDHTDKYSCDCVFITVSGKTVTWPASALEKVEEKVKTEFKVGDRVVVVESPHHEKKYAGKPATITGGSFPWEIEFDEPGLGHDFCGSNKNGRFVETENLRHITAPDSDIMQTILIAINDKKLVGMSYEDAKGKDTYRVFKPNTIVEKNGLTINGYCHLRREYRGLKMANIKKAWLLGEAE